MELFGFTITRTKGYVAPIGHTDTGWKTIYESFAGAWQRNITKSPKDLLTQSTVYACVTLIAEDCGKIGLNLVELSSDGIWRVTENGSHSPVLRKPNRYQTRQQFIEQWVLSKLIHGNTYVWKERDDRNVVIALYVLDPRRVRAFVAPDGAVFYQIGNDNLAGIQANSIQVPASEIMHDLISPLYHPLCGISPLVAVALSACHSLNMQEHASKFFANAAQPGGILTAPGHIPQELAEFIKKQWEERFSGDNVGRIVVAGDGLDYKALGMMTAEHAQMIEQLKWTAEQICSVFKVPPHMVGVGPPPAHNNIEALNAQYYAQCIQKFLEAIEALLDEGLGLTTTDRKLGTMFDLDDLLRTDAATMADAVTKLTGGFIISPDEARKKFNYGPVAGGSSPLAQQQNFSLAALAKRDARADPFGTATPAPAAAQPPDDEDDDETDDEDVTRDLISAIKRKFDEARLAA